VLFLAHAHQQDTHQRTLGEIEGAVYFGVSQFEGGGIGVGLGGEVGGFDIYREFGGHDLKQLVTH